MTEKLRLLVVEDDSSMRKLLQDVLEKAGYEVIAFEEGRSAERWVNSSAERIDLVLTDIRMQGLTGAELLELVKARRPDVPVILITAFGGVEEAVRIVKSGASHYLVKPFKIADLLQAVKDALADSEALREQAQVRKEYPELAERLIGVSRPMRDLCAQITLAARSASTVLITGESGTGKELVARSLHDLSGRPGAFVPVNCAAIPSELIESELYGHTGQAFTGAKQTRIGMFETASGGTIFLDEVGELPLAVQPKLLRTLQEGSIRRVGASTELKVPVRVVAATNRNLEESVRKGEFREDLFWRLNVIQLDLPPLRERVKDIPLLVAHFLRKIADLAGKPPLKVSREALTLLEMYSWPGNVRELENSLERAAAFAQGKYLRPEDLPARVRAGGEATSVIAAAQAQRMTMRELEREYILRTLRAVGGNKSRAAELLALDRTTLYRKLDEYRNDGGDADE